MSPAPGMASTSVAGVRSSTAARIARARGCSLRASSAAATARTCCRVTPGVVVAETTAGRLRVRVPVLSSARPRTAPSASSAAPPLMSTPSSLANVATAVGRIAHVDTGENLQKLGRANFRRTCWSRSSSHPRLSIVGRCRSTPPGAQWDCYVASPSNRMSRWTGGPSAECGRRARGQPRGRDQRDSQERRRESCGQSRHGRRGGRPHPTRGPAVLQPPEPDRDGVASHRE